MKVQKHLSTLICLQLETKTHTQSKWHTCTSPGPSCSSSILAFSIRGQASLDKSDSFHSDTKCGCQAFCKQTNTCYNPRRHTNVPSWLLLTYNVAVSVETSHDVVPHVRFTESTRTHLTQVQRFSVVCTCVHTFYNTAQAWTYKKRTKCLNTQKADTTSSQKIWFFLIQTNNGL